MNENTTMMMTTTMVLPITTTVFETGVSRSLAQARENPPWSMGDMTDGYWEVVNVASTIMMMTTDISTSAIDICWAAPMVP